ncbi:hypothetical protein HDV00_007612 [Rhizophlyctis rosea]|nr:hypothetical protein HDV00_007612 [Rhizophlyctis rosea]
MSETVRNPLVGERQSHLAGDYVKERSETPARKRSRGSITPSTDIKEEQQQSLEGLQTTSSVVHSDMGVGCLSSRDYESSDDSEREGKRRKMQDSESEADDEAGVGLTSGAHESLTPVDGMEGDAEARQPSFLDTLNTADTGDLEDFLFEPDNFDYLDDHYSPVHESYQPVHMPGDHPPDALGTPHPHTPSQFNQAYNTDRGTWDNVTASSSAAQPQERQQQQGTRRSPSPESIIDLTADSPRLPQGNPIDISRTPRIIVRPIVLDTPAGPSSQLRRNSNTSVILVDDSTPARTSPSQSDVRASVSSWLRDVPDPPLNRNLSFDISDDDFPVRRPLSAPSSHTASQSTSQTPVVDLTGDDDDDVQVIGVSRAAGRGSGRVNELVGMMEARYLPRNRRSRTAGGPLTLTRSRTSDRGMGGPSSSIIILPAQYLTSTKASSTSFPAASSSTTPFPTLTFPPTSLPPGPLKRIPTLPSRTPSPPPSEQAQLKCAVCLSTPSQETPLSATVCGHIFCEDCIKAAVKATKKCPICRKGLSGRNAVHRLYLS